MIFFLLFRFSFQFSVFISISLATFSIVVWVCVCVCLCVRILIGFFHNFLKSKAAWAFVDFALDLIGIDDDVSLMYLRKTFLPNALDNFPDEWIINWLIPKRPLSLAFPMIFRYFSVWRKTYANEHNLMNIWCEFISLLLLFSCCFCANYCFCKWNRLMVKVNNGNYHLKLFYTVITSVMNAFDP